MPRTPPPTRRDRPKTGDPNERRDPPPSGSGMTVTKTSKKYKAKVKYKRGKSGDLIPVSLANGKPLPGSKPAPAAAPAGTKPPLDPEAAMYGADKEAVDAAAYGQYADQERQLAQAGAGELAHNRDLDVVFDQFKSALLGQKQAADAQAAAVQAGVITSNQRAQGQAAEGMTRAAEGVAATDQTVGTNYAGQVAAQGAGALNGAAAQNAARESELAAVALANQGQLDRLAPLMDLERGVQHGKSQDRLTGLQEQGRVMVGEKASYKRDAFKDIQKTRGDAAQQEIENELAKEAIVSGDTKSRRDYDARIQDIRTRERINTADNRTDAEIAADRNATSERNNRRSTAATTTSAKVRARATENAAKIRGAGSSKADIHITDSNGRVVKMTQAERTKWTQRRAAAISAHRDLRSELAKEGDEGKAVKNIAKRHHLPENVVRALLAPAKGKKTSDPNALKSYFPGGVIPPGYLADGGAK